MNWMNAISLVTVPKISVIMRKSYGQAYLNMGGGRNSDEVLAWPARTWASWRPASAPTCCSASTSRTTPSAIANWSRSCPRTPRPGGWPRCTETHAVIDPRETRAHLIRLLDIHRGAQGRRIGQHLLSNWPTTY